MRIDVAGAGAGKTTNMASRILKCKIPDGQMVYCVAFTNAAAENIRAKLVELRGSIPDNVKISTIHSFLYTELIQPYYHLLFDKRYQGVSVIKLPDDNRYRYSRIMELEKQGLIHQTVIPQRAKWVADKKSGERARERALRAKVLTLFASYCCRLFVDEAQDIDNEIKAVFVALDRAGVNVELSGDPKQDVKGYNCFRELIDICGEVTYTAECHRCPQVHLQLSNTLAVDDEKQVADGKNSSGSITVHLESETDTTKLIEEGNYGLVYISRKNERFETHARDEEDKRLPALHHEFFFAIRSKSGVSLSDLAANRVAYYMAKRTLSFVGAGAAPKKVINYWIKHDLIDFDAKSYARIAGMLKVVDSINDNVIAVKSIEAVKGLQHEKCLFVLTRDLAPYLFGDRIEENKTKHLLYVALTRSLDELSILVTSEVERMYSRERIFALENKGCA